MGTYRTAEAWLEYGREYAAHPSLWDGSLAFASGPLQNEGGTLRDYSGRTTGAVWSVGAGDTPKYERASFRGQGFWAGRYDGLNDTAKNASPGFETSFPTCLAFWLRTRSVGLAYIFQASVYAAGLNMFSVAQTYNGTNIAFYYFQDGKARSTPYIVSLNAWQHHAFCFDSPALVRYFLNGGQVAIDQPAGAFTPGAAGIYINGLDSISGYFCNADLAAIGVYKKSLTPAEIATLARHPLAAYEVEVPQYYLPPATVTGWKPWLRTRQRHRLGA
jgi:hypothetical protein